MDLTPKPEFEDPSCVKFIGAGTVRREVCVYVRLEKPDEFQLPVDSLREIRAIKAVSDWMDRSWSGVIEVARRKR